MKKKLILVIFLIGIYAHAQQKQFEIQWDGYKTLFTSSYKVEVPSFSKENFNYNAIDGLQFITQWQGGFIDEASVSVGNVIYETISRVQLKDTDVSTIPNRLKFSAKNTEARGVSGVEFKMSPVIKINDNSFQRVTSFTVNYDTGSYNRNANNNSQNIDDSALSTGQWFKFYIDKTGVFRLSKSFLSNLGVNVNDIDPRTIKLYGNGGNMIPYSNALPQSYDVRENAIRVVGESDGSFNDNDYILFYGQGPKSWDAEKGTHINCYTNRTYYYINISPGLGKRIQPFIQPTGNVDMEINTFHDYKFHESDEFNLVRVGRRWFGDRFDIENNKTFTFQFPDLVETEPIYFNIQTASTAEVPTSLDVSVNSQDITTLTFSPITDSNLAIPASYAQDVSVNSSTITVNLDYNNGGNPSSIAYLDYIAIEATRNLNFSGNQLTFKNNDVSNEIGVGQYNVTNTSQVSEIWDVTDIYNVTNFVNTDNSNTLSFTSNLGSEKSYALVTPSDYYQAFIGERTRVSNQNLKGTIFQNQQGEFEDIDYLIVARQNMLNQAERLAQINRSYNNLNVKVVTLNQIYSEFSTSNPDIGAIRNLVKYIYDNASSSENRIKYLCLFGDASFDYKNRIENNTNIVPSWHAYNSFNLTNSFVSDDFYGMMGDNEGTMLTSDKLDIAVGRILADTPQRARVLVDKVETYYKEASYGRWRNNFVVVSDDIDVEWESVLQETTDGIANTITEEHPFLNPIKIHMDAYQQESSAAGDRYPGVTTDMLNAIENGALVVNYFGHGGEDGLAHERIFQKQHSEGLRNVCKLNCFVTVTCEYTRFDNPLRPTAGELTYWNKEGGAIGLISTTRQIFVNVGITFNNVLEEYLFSFNDDDNYQDHEFPSMAEALRLTKNNPSISGIGQRRLVFFIGDPAMKLAFPKPNVRLTAVNDVPLNQGVDVLKALDRVKIAGEVTDISGNVLSNYNGVLSTTIFDKKIDRETLGNDGIRSGGQLIIMPFETLGETLFRGQASITNGQFEFEFVMPRDIGINEGYGKVSFYAKQDGQLNDQSGAAVNTILIGGINNEAPEDNNGPIINLFMNDESFVSGGITNQSPSLLVKLEDDNGINTASGIGHDIVAIIDGDETNPFVLNDYYETELDNFQKGIVNYPFRNLEPGLHTLTLKAWDVYNNSSTSEIQFVVQNENQQLVIDNVLNYPNPFVNYTEFWFNHNSSSPLNVSVQIFTVSGKLVRTLNSQTNSSNCCNNGASSLSRDIIWDGRDDFGDKIGKGVYVYKLKVHSPSLNKTVEKIEKLVIL
ncbi:type IX secretion system sortase PorU [Mangrovimonas spongiae]|uniref:Type IX secretion system sortase PorU n=2 Tax=Mangrovimonas spongiae TaxID=2494697 RepID=A0A428K2K5_9FLAO|nr:type IX secretion system sortase PorU [Mangrovimonas spongiae]